jgi:hypothetical protein
MHEKGYITSLSDALKHGCWHQDGSIWVVILMSPPKEQMLIGLGPDPYKAICNVEITPIQSTGSKKDFCSVLDWAYDNKMLSSAKLKKIENKEAVKAVKQLGFNFNSINSLEL